MANKNLQKAKAAKNDEFYTQLSDVSDELKHYRKHFKDAVVFCNCDDPDDSAFWKYFHLNFEFFGMKKLIATHYDKDKPTYKLEYEGGEDGNTKAGKRTNLQGNGDFRNQECLDLMDEADIVVTNPPFSMLREFVATLMEHGKKFVIWSNNNAITYKEIFPLIKENKIWLGYLANRTCVFRLSDDYEKWDEKITAEKNDGHKYGKVPAISVFTNLDIEKRHERLILWKKYNPEEFPKYDNYDAINVDKVASIPVDYCESWEVSAEELEKLPEGQWEVARESERDGKKTAFVIPAEGTELRQVLHEHGDGYREKIEEALAEELIEAGYCPGCIGVPITFLDKHNPDEFEIVKFRHGDDGKDLTYTETGKRESNKTPDTGHRTPDTGHRTPDTGHRTPDTGHRTPDALLPDYRQKDTVMESWVCPSHSLAATIQTILPSSKEVTGMASLTLGDTTKKLKQSIRTGTISMGRPHISGYTFGGSREKQSRYCNGVIGAPITFLDKHNPEEFSIEEPPRKECVSVSLLTENSKSSQSVKVERERELRTAVRTALSPGADGWHINGKRKYARVFIRKIL